MRLAVTVAVAPPAGTPPLDPLQAEGVAAILHEVIGWAYDAVHPDGGRITVVDRWVGSHPDGALVALIVDAAREAPAGEAVTALVEHVVQTYPSLAGWQVTDVAVEPSARDDGAIITAGRLRPLRPQGTSARSRPRRPRRR